MSAATGEGAEAALCLEAPRMIWINDRRGIVRKVCHDSIACFALSPALGGQRMKGWKRSDRVGGRAARLQTCAGLTLANEELRT